jgi:hypothetical protein
MSLLTIQAVADWAKVIDYLRQNGYDDWLA